MLAPLVQTDVEKEAEDNISLDVLSDMPEPLTAEKIPDMNLDDDNEDEMPTISLEPETKDVSDLPKKEEPVPIIEMIEEKQAPVKKVDVI